MPVYNDVIRFYKYNTRITQTNPDAVVSEEEIKAKEEEINQKVEIVDHGDWRNVKVVMYHIGLEINDKAFDYNLSMLCYDEKETVINPERYAALGRDSLITLFKNADMRGHTTTVEELKDNFVLFLIANVCLDKNTLSFFIEDESYIGDLRINYMTYNLNTHLTLPEEFIKEYILVYDRFDNRNYFDTEGNTYVTKVVCKPLKNVLDFDGTAVSPYPFHMNVIYPIIQLYKNAELIYEGRLDKYTEEYKKTILNTRTNVNFRAYTLKEKCLYELSYTSYYDPPQFELRVLNYANPHPGIEFTTEKDIFISIKDDFKSANKKSVSFADNIYSSM